MTVVEVEIKEFPQTRNEHDAQFRYALLVNNVCVAVPGTLAFCKRDVSMIETICKIIGAKYVNKGVTPCAARPF